MKPGPKNLITDVPGLKVGNSEDHHLKSGVTILVGDKPFVASVDVMGGAPRHPRNRSVGSRQNGR